MASRKTIHLHERGIIRAGGAGLGLTTLSLTVVVFHLAGFIESKIAQKLQIPPRAAVHCLAKVPNSSQRSSIFTALPPLLLK